MPPANRKNPERAKSSQSLYSLHEFQREFPTDEACLEWLWRERHSQDGDHAHCPKCDRERRFRRISTSHQDNPHTLAVPHSRHDPPFLFQIIQARYVCSRGDHCHA